MRVTDVKRVEVAFGYTLHQVEIVFIRIQTVQHSEGMYSQSGYRRFVIATVAADAQKDLVEVHNDSNSVESSFF